MCDNHPTKAARPVCIFDGEADPRVLEFHYVGEIRIVLCRNCLSKLADTARQPKAIWDPPDELEVIAWALLAEADLFAMLASSRRKLALTLIDRVRREAPDENPS